MSRINELTDCIKEIIKIPPRKRTDEDKDKLRSLRAERKRLKWNDYISSYCKRKRQENKRFGMTIHSVSNRLHSDSDKIKQLKATNSELQTTNTELNKQVVNLQKQAVVSQKQIIVLQKQVDDYRFKLIRLSEKLTA